MGVLYFAINNNSVEMVKLLLSNPDIDVNMKNEYDIFETLYIYRTPLHYAVRNGNTDIINLLLANKKIKVDVKDNIFLSLLS